MGDLYLDWEYRVTSLQLVVAMLAMGATLHVRDFLAVVRVPRSFLIGLAVQVLAVPAVAYVLLRWVDLEPGVAVGLAILAAVPGGTVSNVFTYAGRGDVPLSIAITAVTTLACIVSVPIVLGALVGPYVPSDFTLPRGRIAAEIVATLLVPLAAGMALLRLRPRIAAWVAPWGLRAVAVLILVIVAGSAAAGRLDAEAMGLRNLGVVAAFAVAVCVLGVGAAVLTRRTRPAVTAIAVEVTVRNTNLALLIRASLFPVAATGVGTALADLALFTILTYAGISFVLVAPLVIAGRRAAPPGRGERGAGPVRPSGGGAAGSPVPSSGGGAAGPPVPSTGAPRPAPARRTSR